MAWCSMLPRRITLSSVSGKGWFNLCSLIAQCATGVQPHPAPESNQSESGQIILTRSYECVIKSSDVANQKGISLKYNN